MPILIMAVIALLAFIAIVGLVCAAGLAEERALRALDNQTTPESPDQTGQVHRKSAAA